MRTPEERFDALTDWPFGPSYVEVSDPDGGSSRLHLVDEGDRAGRPIVLLHGEPTWSYLCLSDVIVFCQDWGGLIGLRLVAENAERFAAVVASNTGLPTGDRGATEDFRVWQQAASAMPSFPTGRIVDGGTLRSLSEAEIAAYDAPFPDDSYQAGARVLPKLVPTEPDDPAATANRAAWISLAGFERPFVTAFAEQDPITRGGDRPMRERIPGAAGRAHRTIEHAGHFVQEDAPDAVAEVILELAR